MGQATPQSQFAQNRLVSATIHVIIPQCVLTLYLPGTTAHLAFCLMAVMTAAIWQSTSNASLLDQSILTVLVSCQHPWLVKHP